MSLLNASARVGQGLSVVNTSSTTAARLTGVARDLDGVRPVGHGDDGDRDWDGGDGGGGKEGGRKRSDED